MSMGGGGGGGTSGAVDWPDYFETWHGNLLGDSTSITIDTVDAITTASSANPYTGITAYDPDTDLTAVDTAMTSVLTVAQALDPDTDWAAYIATVEAEVEAHVYDLTAIAAAESAYDAQVDAEYNTITLPRFQRGMQDANAVMSSAYVVGTALLEAEVLRKKAMFSSEIRLQAYRDKTSAIMSGVESLIRLASIEYDFRRTVVATMAETKRIKLVALKEETDLNLKIDEMDVKWNLELLTMAGNILASGHGAVSGNTTKATPLQSALGGAMSGAATGGMLAYGAAQAMGVASAGPVGWGIGLGALAGAAMGLFG